MPVGREDNQPSRQSAGELSLLFALSIPENHGTECQEQQWVTQKCLELHRINQDLVSAI